ncbi:CoA ester lyase [Fodinisporobacter ferrooxydans]|uniref:CoA ester lyase n=1 Tax=Fodinisporobacter ferrooxydans TaxID=2901836 RepID=A0ABY4CI90_9BACL|nr:CoA ester lyase [Alicyclobacillaceae bacterium MYW30-H2]
MRLFRSWMFVPGSDIKKIEKSKQLSADVVIYDLEDAVSLTEKDSARKLVKQVVQAEVDRIHFVKINSISSPLFLDDLDAIAEKGLSGIVLPKSENKEQIVLLDDLLNQFEMKRSIHQKIEIMPLIESASGLYNAYEIAQSSSRIKRLAFGAVDFSLDIHAELTKEGTELLYARSQLVVASRAAGVEPPIDAVYLDFKDYEGLKRETSFVKQLGFQGKLVIHPNQIETVNAVFLPTAAEIEEGIEVSVKKVRIPFAQDDLYVSWLYHPAIWCDCGIL